MFEAFARRPAARSITEDQQPSTFPVASLSSAAPFRHVHIAILGTGFSGLGMAIRLKQEGREDFVVIERASDIGGTWRDNTYPGCACDIPSHLYSFSFALNPNWSRAYSPQREIQQYLRDCAKRYGILPHILWNHELLDSSWDDAAQCWQLVTSQGPLKADILVLGNGPLSEPSLPRIPGLDTFEGTLFHSARWQHDYDLRGKRVAVIGTGASAIQFVPQIQPQVAHLSLFQRTPPWIFPRMDHAIPAWKQRMYRFLPFTQRLKRMRIYARQEFNALGLIYRPQMLDTAMKIALAYLEREIPDPALRAKLTPNYTLGCKRVLISDDFYASLTQPNVEVVTNPIREIRAHSVVTQDGTEQEVDAIICATGFHVTDRDLPRCAHGRDGQSLEQKWSSGLNAYLGTTVSGFPNMFLLIGPHTGLGHNSMVYMIESQLSYILDCLHLMERQYVGAVEVKPASEEAFRQEMERRMQGTAWTSGCQSWYLDAMGHNTTLWPGFTFEFRRRTRRFDPQQYEMTPQSARIAVPGTQQQAQQ